MSFGKLIQSRRHISQEKLAREVGVSVKTIGNIERDRHDPRLSTALKICRILGIKHLPL